MRVGETSMHTALGKPLQSDPSEQALHARLPPQDHQGQNLLDQRAPLEAPSSEYVSLTSEPLPLHAFTHAGNRGLVLRHQLLELRVPPQVLQQGISQHE